jgi:hypothetical protein
MRIRSGTIFFCNTLHGKFVRMLTKDEQSFVEYWEKNRNKQKHFLYQLASGLPFGLVFALPVLVALIFHSWYKTMVYISGSQVFFITIAVLGVAVFLAMFRKKFKWESNEQLYKELKFKEGKDDTAHI